MPPRPGAFFLPPTVLMCIALLAFFASWRRTGVAEDVAYALRKAGAGDEDGPWTTGLRGRPSLRSYSSSSSLEPALDNDPEAADALEVMKEELEDEREAIASDASSSSSSAPDASDASSSSSDAQLNDGDDDNDDAPDSIDSLGSADGDGLPPLPVDTDSPLPDDDDDDDVASSKSSTTPLTTTVVPPDHLVIAGVGDVLMLTSMTREAQRAGNFSHFWAPLTPLFRRHAHFVFANLEGTAGPVNTKGQLVKPKSVRDSEVYSERIDKGGFNYHESLVSDLVQTGVDVLTQANNHAFDRGVQGIATTGALIERAGGLQIGAIQGVGDPARAHLRPPDGWYRITETSNGWRVAWVGCTNLLCADCRDVHRVSQSEIKRRILFCEDAPALIKSLAKRPDVDAVVVGAHWGAQFVDQYAARTAALAHKMLDAGAAVVFGNHPHVMQGAEHYLTRDRRNTYVTYSIGSLTSGLGTPVKWWKSRTSSVVFVELEKRSGKLKTAQVAKVRFVPICEVKLPNNLRAMMPTSKTVPKNLCKKEDHWARYLLGDEDHVLPEKLPQVVNRGRWKLVRGTPEQDKERDRQTMRMMKLETTSKQASVKDVLSAPGVLHPLFKSKAVEMVGAAVDDDDGEH